MCLIPVHGENLWSDTGSGRLKGPEGTSHAASEHHGPRFKLTAAGLQLDPSQVTALSFLPATASCLPAPLVVVLDEIHLQFSRLRQFSQLPT